MRRMRERMRQQHACSRSAASGRVLDQPSDHDPLHRKQQILFWAIHMANVASTHATVERAMVRARAGGTFECIKGAPFRKVEQQLDGWR